LCKNEYKTTTMGKKKLKRVWQLPTNKEKHIENKKNRGRRARKKNEKKNWCLNSIWAPL
jgi:DNA-binding PadR family transcriptional regulator